MMLSVAQVAKTYGPTQILENVSFVLNPGDRAGLIGPNGAGKSTLLRIITGEVVPDAGQVAIARDAVVGYLPQQPPDVGDATVDGVIRDALGDLRDLEHRIRELEARMSVPDDALERVLTEYAELQQRFEQRGGYDLDYRIDIVLAGLCISSLPRDRHFANLSGGEKARVQLAALLLEAPDLLLLDEPTNHLDFAAIDWLEGFLGIHSGTVLVISHDRHFLNRTVTRILELDEHKHAINEYAGNYDDYLRVRESARALWIEDYAAQQEEIRELRRMMKVTGRQVAHNRPPRDPDKTAYDFKGARVQDAISRNVRSAEERLRRIQEDPIPKPPGELRISPAFESQEIRSAEIIVARGVSKLFGTQRVLHDISLTVGPRARIVIVGPNGAGKSTLLDILAGVQQPDSGEVVVARGATLGYLDQDARELDPQRTVIDSYRDGIAGHEAEIINDLFHFGLFTIDDLRKTTAQLSAGQKRKLQLARLVAEAPNTLLLDEPTNHLSFDILEEFEKALLEFPGPILAVSHDRWFIERFAEQVWELRDGSLLPHAGAPSDVLAGMLQFRPIGAISVGN